MSESIWHLKAYMEMWGNGQMFPFHCTLAIYIKKKKTFLSKMRRGGSRLETANIRVFQN